MKLRGIVWIACISALVLAGPVYPQNKTEQAVLQMQRDVLMLQNQMKELQASVDQNNQKLGALTDKLSALADSMNASLPKIGDAVSSIKSDNEKSANDLKALVGAMKDGLDQLNQNLNGREGVNARLGAVSQQLKDMRAAASTQPLETAEDLLRTAYADFSAGLWPLSIGDFKGFLAKYSTHPRAADAQYHIAEAYYAQKKWDQAIAEYDTLLQKYPNSDTTASALFKEGLAYKELGQDDKATAALERLVMELPSSQEAGLAKLKLMEWNPPPPPQRGTTQRGTTPARGGTTRGGKTP